MPLGRVNANFSGLTECLEPGCDCQPFARRFSWARKTNWLTAAFDRSGGLVIFAVQSREPPYSS